MHQERKTIFVYRYFGASESNLDVSPTPLPQSPQGVQESQPSYVPIPPNHYPKLTSGHPGVPAFMSVHSGPSSCEACGREMQIAGWESMKKGGGIITSLSSPGGSSGHPSKGRLCLW